MGELDDFRDDIANRNPRIDWLAIEMLKHLARTNAVSVGTLIFDAPAGPSRDLPEGEPVALVLAVVGDNTKRVLDAYHEISKDSDHIGILMGPNGKVVRTWRGGNGGGPQEGTKDQQ